MGTPKKIADLLRSSDAAFSQLSYRLHIGEARLIQLRDGGSPRLTEIVSIGEYFGQNLSRLINAELEIKELSFYPLVEKAEAENFVNRHRDTDYINELDAYNIPGFSGEGLIIFSVEDEGMAPTISRGDYLVCEKSGSPNDLEEGAVVVAISQKKIYLRRFFKEGVKHIFQSDNKSVEQESLSIDEVSALWRVIGKVTREFLTSSKDKIDRLDQMKSELTTLKDDLGKCLEEFNQVKKQFVNGKK